MKRLFPVPTILVLVLSGCGGGSSNNIPPSANPISAVQAAGHAEDSSSLCNGCSNIAVSLPNPVSNGDLLGVVLWWNQANPTATSVTVTDSQNNNYTNIAPTNNFSWATANTLAYGFYARNVAGGSNFTVTASTNPGNGFAYYIAVVEAKNASVFDQWVAGSNCTNAQGCTIFTTSPLQVTHADTLLIGMGSLTGPSGGCQGCAAQPLGAGPSFTLINDNNNHIASASEYLVITTPGQSNGVFTASNPANAAQLFLAFY